MKVYEISLCSLMIFSSLGGSSYDRTLKYVGGLVGDIITTPDRILPSSAIFQKKMETLLLLA